ncbi:hypothetical protein VYU27_007593, partial [Nannochloropsis oceanica]
MSRGVPKISGGGGDGGDIDFSSYKDPLTGRQGRLLNASSFASSSSDGSSSSSPSYQPHSSPLPPPPPPLHPASYRPVSSTAMGGGAGNDTPCQLFIGSRAGIKGRSRGKIWSSRPRPNADGTLLWVRNGSSGGWRGTGTGGAGGGGKATSGASSFSGEASFKVVAWEEEAQAFATADERGQIHLFHVIKNNYILVKGPGYQVSSMAFVPSSSPLAPL